MINIKMKTPETMETTAEGSFTTLTLDAIRVMAVIGQTMETKAEKDFYLRGLAYALEDPENGIMDAMRKGGDFREALEKFAEEMEQRTPDEDKVELSMQLMKGLPLEEVIAALKKAVERERDERHEK